jgi:hypothetical protein
MPKYEICVEMKRPQKPRMKKARMEPAPSSRTVSAPDRSRSTTRKAEAMAQRTAVRKTGGKYSRASLAVDGNVPHSVAMRKSAT